MVDFKKLSKIDRIYKARFVGKLAVDLAHDCLNACPVDESYLSAHPEMTELLSETARRIFRAGVKAGLDGKR